ncbi:MAG: alpha/beta hydrolase [Lachnospiraceae bacterium]|nr:alpha/beta hydrolase [Lachnospiraceae bacterium]
MNKRDIGILLGGTVAGMSLTMVGAAYTVIKENFMRRKPYVPKPGQIESVDEMHADYLRRKGIAAIKAQKVEKVGIVSRDGLSLNGHYVHNTEAKRTPGEPVNVVLLSHGYGGSGYKDLSIFAEFYVKQGYDILVIDQRAHGNSEGRYITFGDHESDDVAGWVDKIIEIAGDNCRILLHGWSMGAATVYLAAAKGLPKQVKGLIYDCGYSTAEAQMFHIAKKSMGLPDPLLWYMLQFIKPVAFFFCGFSINSASPILASRNMTLPILFVHGAKDSVVPVKMGRRLYHATIRTDYRRMLIVPDADHTYSYVYDKTGYENAIKSLMKYCMA